VSCDDYSMSGNEEHLPPIPHQANDLCQPSVVRTP
jgi:hypothetical protein